MRTKGLDNHVECEAVVLSCVDYRFWLDIVDYVQNVLNIRKFDFPSIPGGVQAIIKGNELALNCIHVPVALHQVSKIILVNHEDCGAYGGSENFLQGHGHERTTHENDLSVASRILSKKYPDLEIIALYASFQGIIQIELPMRELILN